MALLAASAWPQSFAAARQASCQVLRSPSVAWTRGSSSTATVCVADEEVLLDAVAQQEAVAERAEFAEQSLAAVEKGEA